MDLLLKFMEGIAINKIIVLKSPSGKMASQYILDYLENTFNLK
jgi:hypothetical protein